MFFIKEICKRLDKQYVFVFPSEAAAQSALLASLKESGKKALSSARFISWDTYKSRIFPGPEGIRPASKALRLIFSNKLLLENQDRAFLKFIIPENYSSASGRFTSYIASALPGLFSLPEDGRDFLGDWAEIKKRYSAFMKSTGYYEPSWESRRASKNDQAWFLLYPDLNSDWDNYSPIISTLDNTEILLSDSLGNGKVEATEYNTLTEEIRATLLAIRNLTEKGKNPSSIIISLAAPDSCLPLLKREAFCAGIKLNTRKASPLSDSCGGRLFNDILALAGKNTDFAALRRLLLDGSRPWKEEATARRLLARGIERHLLAQLPEQSDPSKGLPKAGTKTTARRKDSWEEALQADPEAKSLYKGIKTSAANICDAKSFTELRNAFNKFKKAFFIEENWNKKQNDEIARSMILLDELADAEDYTGVKDISGIASLYSILLSDSLYLEAGSSRAVSVYPFPAAAAAAPDYHYVLNLNQKSARAESRPLAFLRPDTRDKLDLADRDYSAMLIRLLALSGKSVSLSYSVDGPDGVSPPHPVLDLNKHNSYKRDDWLINKEAGGLSLQEVFPVQKASATAALKTVFPQKIKSWSQGLPSKPVLIGPFSKDNVIQKEFQNGIPKLSASSIEEYDSCAFRRIYDRILGISEQDSGLSFIDNRLLGGIYHNAFSFLLKPLAEKEQSIVAGTISGESLRPDNNSAVSAMEKAMDTLYESEGPLAFALVHGIYPMLVNAFLDACSVLRKLADGYKVLYADNRWIEAKIDDNQIAILGRPDLVCIKDIQDSEKEVLIIDFKKKYLPEKKYLSLQEDGSLIKLQIPIYSLLAESLEYRLTKAFLLSIEGLDNDGAKTRLVLGYENYGRQSPAIHLENKELMEKAIEKKAKEIAIVLKEGYVFVPELEDRFYICSNCRYKRLCRVHFTMR